MNTARTRISPYGWVMIILLLVLGAINFADKAVIYLAGCYGVFALEELLSLLGTPVRESFLPAIKQTSSPDTPT